MRSKGSILSLASALVVSSFSSDHALATSQGYSYFGTNMSVPSCMQLAPAALAEIGFKRAEKTTSELSVSGIFGDYIMTVVCARISESFTVIFVVGAGPDGTVEYEYVQAIRQKLQGGR